jgi:aminoglycoside phosphotransferase (APT) family kinase protein
MTVDGLLAELYAEGLLGTPQARAVPLSGGVSSEILLVDDGTRQLVVKRALPKLRVKEDWFADVSRNRHEQEYLDYVAAILPQAVPRIVYRNPRQGYFAMEYLGEGFQNWKAQLLAGQADARTAGEAARILGTIHRHSWGEPVARQRFQTTPNFFQLRLNPYLLTTGSRHAELRETFEAEARRLAGTALCLVHGDYSPKNLMVCGPRVVVLDCEAAWYGDPAFDVAFLLNHLCLKALVNTPLAALYLELARGAWSAYRGILEDAQLAGLEQRTAHLLLMLMLARVDGKSPVEYLDPPRQQLVRRFVRQELPRRPTTLAEVLAAWESELATFNL